MDPVKEKDVRLSEKEIVGLVEEECISRRFSCFFPKNLRFL